MKKKIALLALLLALVLCFSLTACDKDDPTPTPSEKVYAIAVSGSSTRTLTVGDAADTLTWTVTCDGQNVTEKATVSVSGTAVALSDQTATSVKVTAVEPGNARITVKLDDHQDVFANVTYSVNKPDFFGQRNGSWSVNDNNASVEAGQQATILTREKGKTWMFSAELDITDYTSQETIAIGSFLTTGGNALWFGLRNSDGNADGRFSVYIRNFLDGWEKATYDANVTGYTRYTGTEKVKFTLIRNGLDYYYNIDGMFGKYTDTHDVETYAGFQTQQQAVAIKGATLVTDSQAVQEAIPTVYPTDGVGAISISGPATLVPQIVSGDNGTQLQFTAKAYADCKEVADQDIVWSLDSTLGADNASVSGDGLLVIKAQTEGRVTVKATLGNLSDEITFDVIKQEIIEENDNFIAKGGVQLDGEDGLVFSPDYVGSAVISSDNEQKFNENYTYGATLKQKVTGNFSIEFTVSDYVATSQTPKLMFSLGSNANNFFVVYGAFTRIEAFTNINNNGFLQGGWFQGDGMSDLINVGGATRYKIAVEKGIYAVYAMIGNDWQKLTITQNGKALPMVRSYEDFVADREIIIGANALSCKISNVVVNNGTANDEYTFIQHGMLTYSSEYEFDSASDFTVGFQATDWEGKNGSTVAKRIEALPATFTLSFNLKYATEMTDAKFAIMFGNTAFIVNNKLAADEAVLSATRLKGDDWNGSITKTVATSNQDLVVTITRDSKGVVRFYVNDIKISEDAVSDNNMSMYTFGAKKAPDENTNNGCTVAITNFTIGEYTTLNTWKLSVEEVGEIKVNATEGVVATVKHDGAVVADGYTIALVSADPETVNIVSGKLVGVKAGKTTITVNVMVGDDVVATTQFEVVVPEIQYTYGFKGIDGDTVTIKQYSTLQLTPFVTADIDNYTPEFTVTLGTTDVVTMDKETYLITAAGKEGTATVTLAIEGTELTKTLTIVVSSEVQHNYKLTATAKDGEIHGGDGTTIGTTLSDNGQTVADATIEYVVDNADVMSIANGVVTTVETAVKDTTTVKVTVKALVDGEVVATTTVEITVKPTTYELTVDGSTTIELEYGKDTANVTFKATRNGVEMKDYTVSVTLPDNGILEYANGTFTAKKAGTGNVTFVLGDNLAQTKLDYTVTANLFSTTRKRGDVQLNGNTVKIGGGSGIAATYPAKVWKIGGTVSFDHFDNSSPAEIVGFTSGKNKGDTFDATLMIGLTGGSIKGMRYINWYPGWGWKSGQNEYFEMDGYYNLDMSVVYAATENKYWEFIRIDDDYYFMLGDFYGKFTLACEEATFPGIFAQFGCNFTVSDVVVDYNEESVNATAATYASKTAYSVLIEGNTEHTLGTKQKYTAKVVPSICQETVTWSIDTANLTAGQADLVETSNVQLSEDAIGSYVITATAKSGAKGSLTVTATGDRVYTENDDFTAYGGVKLKDNGESYKIIFADMSKDGVADECNWSDSQVYTANYRKTVKGNFTVEFTVSNYVAGSGYAKLALSIQGGRTQFYVAHNDNGYRIETYTMCVWADGGYSDGGTWASTDFFTNFDPLASHTYKIQMVNGSFHIYVDGTEYLIKTDNGSLTYANRTYADWTSEKQLRFASKNCTAEVSNIKITEQGMPNGALLGYYSNFDPYNADTKAQTAHMYSRGWDMENRPLTVYNNISGDYEMKFDMTFSDAMADAKVAIKVNNERTWYIDNKLNNGDANSKYLNVTNASWEATHICAELKTLHITITRVGTKMTLTVQVDGNEAITATEYDRANGNVSFFVFNESSDDENKSVTFGAITITAK